MLQRSPSLLLVDVQARDPTAQLRAIGDTLAWPARLLGRASPEEILLSPEIGRVVEGRCEVPLQGRQAGRIGVYAVVGNRPQGSRLEMQGLRPLPRLVGRERELAGAELAAAIELYRAMEMTFWLPQAEAALAQIGGWGP